MYIYESCIIYINHALKADDRTSIKFTPFTPSIFIGLILVSYTYVVIKKPVDY